MWALGQYLSCPIGDALPQGYPASVSPLFLPDYPFAFLKPGFEFHRDASDSCGQHDAKSFSFFFAGIQGVGLLGDRGLEANSPLKIIAVPFIGPGSLGDSGLEEAEGRFKAQEGHLSHHQSVPIPTDEPLAFSGKTGEGNSRIAFPHSHVHLYEACGGGGPYQVGEMFSFPKGEPGFGRGAPGVG